MADLLLSEYRTKLASAGALFGCDPPLDFAPDGRRWTAPLGGMHVSLSLIGGDDSARYMVARVQATGTVADDGLMAAVVLADAQATLHRALSCLAMFRGVRVWVADCPCSRCSARGRVSGRDCETCGGTGKRQEPATEWEVTRG